MHINFTCGDSAIRWASIHTLGPVRQANLASAGREAALMHGLLLPAVLAAAENSWRRSQAELDPMKVGTIAHFFLRIQPPMRMLEPAPSRALRIAIACLAKVCCELTPWA